MPERTPLFELNLIGRQVEHLRRRYVIARAGTVAALAMLFLAALLGFDTVTQVVRATRLNAHVRALTGQVEQEKALCAELDAQRRHALEQLGSLQLLLPIARVRTAWAPKLVALAQNLPKGMGIGQVTVQSNDALLFSSSPQPGGKDSPSPSARAAAARPSEFTFSVIYLPSESDTSDLIGALLAGLRGSPAFMRKMNSVRLEASQRDMWGDRPVVVFRGVARGGAPDAEE